MGKRKHDPKAAGRLKARLARHYTEDFKMDRWGLDDLTKFDQFKRVHKLKLPFLANYFHRSLASVQSIARKLKYLREAKLPWEFATKSEHVLKRMMLERRSK